MVKCILTLDLSGPIMKMKDSKAKVTLDLLLQNHLIFSKIFSCLTTLELLSIRFVSKVFYKQIACFIACNFENTSQFNYSNLTNRLPHYVFQNIFAQVLNQNYFFLRSYSRINLSRCHWIEDGQLLQITMRSNSALQELFLDHCWNISYKSLSTALICCPNLEKLSIANIYSIEDQFLASIAECCPKLKWLSVKECWRITDGGIR